MKWMIAALALALGAAPAFAAELGDDGLHKTDWFHVTFLDLQEDAADAAANGKRLLLIVEQRGCLYCSDMHEKTFPDERVQALLRNDYYPVQINLHGDTELVDLDGEILSEKQAARKWGVLFTPTMILLPAEVDAARPAIARASPGRSRRGSA